MSLQKNTAFLFIKPQALTEKVKELLQDTLAQKGLTVLREGQIDAADIDKNMLIDKHYYAIASKATLLTPDQLNVPQTKFQEAFGLSWEAALQSGRAVNAKDACAKLAVNATGLAMYWNMAKAEKKLVKLGGGFYCAKIETKDKGSFYVFNGFFMSMRQNFVAPGAAIYYYVVEWDPMLLPWADFRGKVLGPTDPVTAPDDSLRGKIYGNWTQLGLKGPPTVSDNAVHASASPFEGLCERMNWLGISANEDPFGQLLLQAGISDVQINEWSVDPQVTYGRNNITGSLWDALEDTDVDRCLTKCQMFAGIGSVKTVRNTALVFIKPHALTDKVKTLVQNALRAKGLTILKEAQIDSATIDKDMLIDKHYYSIASKATLLTPDQLNVPKDKFEKKFGLAWDTVLKAGKALNAKDACSKFGVDADTLGKMWNEAKAADQLVKFGGGFYCAKMESGSSGDVYVFNGFFMSMRGKFVAPGAAIYNYVVEWDSLDLSWSGFRSQLLGATDPTKAPADSIRGAILHNWKDLGLSSEPNTGDNGVHASASPFEGLAERMNWLGSSIESDAYGQHLLREGITRTKIEEWSIDPQVTYGPDDITGSLFDALEDTDADICSRICQMIAGVGRFEKVLKNRAFVFIKPHAMTDKFRALVRDTLQDKGLSILSEKQIDGSIIDKDMLIDRHYYSIASKATLLTPDKLNVPKDKFKNKFGIEWEAALKAGVAINAKDACEKFGVDADGLGKLWNEAKAANQLVKFGGGFYCAKMEGAKAGPLYVFNGFFMSMRNKFVAPGAAIYYFVVEWDALDLSWSDFRGQVLGPTDPAQAPADSLRGMLYSKWKDLGLSAEPNTGDNGVHASASAFEGLAERMNWLGCFVEDDAYGRQLLGAGVKKPQIEAWALDPQVPYGFGAFAKVGSLFDAFEDMDADRCLTKCQKFAGVANFAPIATNNAFVFIKPHAVNDQVKKLVETTLVEKGLKVVKQGLIEGSTIDEMKLIDKHYYAIASKATLQKPSELNIPKEKFKAKFGLEWDDQMAAGMIFNAKDACEKLALDAKGLGAAWNEARKADDLVKFGGGFYCARITASGQTLYVLNGFFMEMRDKFCAAGAAIYYYYVEWDVLQLSWSDFRSQVLGPTDPSKAPLTSLRGLLYSKYADYGLSFQPNTADNGVHASASPFEGLVERMNWLGSTCDTDAYGRLLLRSGITRKQIEEWSVDPQVIFGPRQQTGSVFDALEDQDADRCITTCQMISDVSRFATVVKNQAFLFIKPHALTESVKALVSKTLAAKGLKVVKEAQIDGSVIDELKLIDKHYYAIASKATLLTPDQLNVPKDKFKKKFEIDWDEALSSGNVVNGKDACVKLQVDPDGLGKLWNEAKAADKLVKFGGGFYCAKIETADKGTWYVFNGFFMSMRNKFVAAGAAIYYYCVEWDPLDLSWSDFRGQVLGATDPSTAPADSLRGYLFKNWSNLGLKSEPNTGDNGVHASASPFEGLVERMNWLGYTAGGDSYGSALLKAGIQQPMIEDWSLDPQVTRPDGSTGSLWDGLEDTDADRCLTLCQGIAGATGQGRFSTKATNSALVFIKPHALNGKVKKMVEETLKAKGLQIIQDGRIEASDIDKNMLIDKHYYSIASKATLLTPDQLNVPKAKFQTKFGLDWGEALKTGNVVNARDACERLGVDADGLGKLWNSAKDAKKLEKFGGGFYCAQIDSDKGTFYVFNGFFMSMRNKFVALGAAIHYFVVEWDPLKLSWADFRGQVLGPTDPAKASAESLRGTLYSKWKEFELKSEPNTGDNGVHASASPFEGLAERMNWLGQKPSSDAFGQVLLKAGIPVTTLEEWAVDPQVTYGREPTTGSLFDALEDTDVDRCVTKCQLTAGVSLKVASSDDVLKNQAFVFIKPHALTDKVKSLVSSTLQAKGLTIVTEMQIDGSVIDKDMLIDRHYYAIASKATLVTPDKLNVPKDKFKQQFGIDWQDALKSGKAVNAKEACSKLGVDAEKLGKMWNESKAANKLVKLGGGFYCGEIEGYYVFNGFFMSMRNKFVAQGAAIYYYVVEWDPLVLSWADFRGQVLGPTDPAKAPADSLRGILFTRWKELGLSAEPNTGDNGVHASASPFEALAERMNWLGYSPENDVFGRKLLGAGVSRGDVDEWTKDPRVTYPSGDQGSLWDYLEDSDSDRCMLMCQSIGGVGKNLKAAKNRAFVFIKPHALTDSVKTFVRDALKAKGLSIEREAQLDGSLIDQKQLIDKHYYAIASKATLQTPDKLNVPADKFKSKFGLEWADALKSGVAVNAKDACEKLGVDAVALGKLWNEAKAQDKLIKFGGGFYCGKIEQFYVINGFFMSMRNKFVAPGAAIYYYVVEWDPLDLPWSDFRGQVLGPTDPSKAPEDSIRGRLFAKWQEFGLKSEPNTGDNGVHASASPFEGLVERMNWLDHGIEADAFGQLLLQAGLKDKLIQDWSTDPQVVCGDGPIAEPASLFDTLEDTDADRCLTLCQKIARVGRFTQIVKNQAFVFIKPHAMNDRVVALVKDTFRGKGIKILMDARIEGSVIDEKQLIDKHYYAIASKATLLTPDQLNVPAKKFKDKFGLNWDDVLKSGKAVNALEACTKLGVDAAKLATLWNDAKKADKLVKLGGGFYCGLLGEYYVFNAFFMEMRSKFVAPGAAIHYFYVEWDPMSLAWADFRGQILGPTDPAKAPPESLRGALYKDWKAYGLGSEPNTGDNGIHASASPFEGLAERMNWLGLKAEDDAFGTLLLKAGVRKTVIDEWSKDPQVSYGPEHDPKVGSLWDALEDTDAERCLAMCKQIAGIGQYSKNRAFVFIKPHALTDAVKTLVQQTLIAKGLTIKLEAQIDGSVIDEKMLIDKHYYAIASKATLQTPDKLNVPQDKFKSKFGIEWAEALASGSAVNAKDACQKLGVDASSLGNLWNEAKGKDQLIKFGGGFYCAKMEAAGKGPYYVINGFFMSMRSKFVAPGAAIYCYVVEWDPLELLWSDFRGQVLGPTDPAKAPTDSLRGMLFAKWKEYGLKSEPNTGDNGVHASASPFEGLVERMNWLGCDVDGDAFGRELCRAGVTKELIDDWSKDPQVKYGPAPDAASGSLWDALEDTDADRCTLMCQRIASVIRSESSSPQPKVDAETKPVESLTAESKPAGFNLAADSLKVMASLAPSECRIKLVHAREIYDSRGNPTVEVDLVTDIGLFRAAVPSGASTGAYEARELRDGIMSDRCGKGCTKAIFNINKIIGPKLVGMDVTEQRAIDELMVRELDGQQNEWGWSKSKLGANAILAVSMAVCRAGAEATEHMLFHYISRLAKRPNGKFVMPVPAFNIINGGSHAGNRLACQEFMILPVGANSFSEAMAMGSEIYHFLKKVIKKQYGQDACNVGDEGGFAPAVQDSEEALKILMAAIDKAGYTGKIKIATDVAASEFYDASSQLYDFDFKNPMGSPPEAKKTAEQMVVMYKNWFQKYPFASIEDPFDQDDFDAYKNFMAACGKDTQVVGDDLLVTNPRRIQKALDVGACNALLLKVNQIGTVTEAIEAAMMAKDAGWGLMVSHRSGETEDTFISDLAVGLRAGQIKSGAPCRSERLAKYNELLRIEEELGEELCVYAGANFRNP